MTCTRCGSPNAFPRGYCSQCGQQQLAVPAQYPYAYAPRVQRHLHMLSVLWMASGVLYIVGTLIGLTVFKFFFFGRVGHMQMWNNHADSIPWIHVIVPVFFWMISLLGISAIIVGYGLSQRTSWARIAAIVFGCLALLKFPLGTALGIYTLWVLAPAASAMEYDSIVVLPSA